VRHYVLTRAHRGPDYPLDANRRRIELLRGITARSLAAQGTDWTWLVYVHPDDPLREERLDAFRSAGAPVVPLASAEEVDAAIDWSEPVLTTRIDDDDAFAGDAFQRLHRAAGRLRRRTVLVFPNGVRTNEGLCQPIIHMRNAWSSCFAPAGDHAHIRQVVHPKISALAPIVFVDHKPAWLWVRHQDAESGFRRATDFIDDQMRALFPVDWDLLAGVPA
jgi:hypothetical protein